MSKGRSGFSLTELLLVVAVIGILSSLVIVVIGRVRDQAFKSQSYQNLRSLSSALLLYTSEHGGRFPSLMEGGVYVWAWDLQLLPYLDVGASYSGSPTSPLLDPGLELGVFHCPLDERESDPGAAYYPRSYGLPGVTVNQPGADYSGGITGREIGEGISMNQIPSPSNFVVLCRAGRSFEVENNTVGAIGCCLTNGPNPRVPDSAAAIQDWAIFGGVTPYVFADGHLQLLTPDEAEPLWPYSWNINR